MIIEEDTISLPEGFTLRESKEEVLTKVNDDDEKDDDGGDIDLPKGFRLVSIDDKKEETTIEGDPPLPARSVFQREEEEIEVIDPPKAKEIKNVKGDKLATTLQEKYPSFEFKAFEEFGGDEKIKITSLTKKDEKGDPIAWQWLIPTENNLKNRGGIFDSKNPSAYNEDGSIKDVDSYAITAQEDLMRFINQHSIKDVEAENIYRKIKLMPNKDGNYEDITTQGSPGGISTKGQVDRAINIIEDEALKLMTNPASVFGFEGMDVGGLELDYTGLSDQQQLQLDEQVFKNALDRLYTNQKAEPGYNQIPEGERGYALSMEGFRAIYERLKPSLRAQAAENAAEAIYNTARYTLTNQEFNEKYLQLTERKLENNLTQEGAARFTEIQKLDRINNKILDIEAKTQKTTADENQLTDLKRKRDLQTQNIKNLAFDASGSWKANQRKLVSKEKQKELDKITNAAAQLALQFNIDLSSGSVEERQSTRGLGKQYFKDAVLENEYIYKLGKEHKFTQTIDIKDSEFSLSKDQFTNWLEKNDRDYKVISNNKIEVYKTFNQAFKDGTRRSDLEGWMDEWMWKDMSTKDEQQQYKVWLEEKLENEALLRGLYDLTYLNLAPEGIEKPEDEYGGKAGWAKVFTRGAVESTLGWLGYAPDQIQKGIGRTFRNELDEMRGAIDLINNSPKVKSGEISPIELSDKQLEQFEQTLNEYTANGTGHFAPDLLILMGMGSVAGGLGILNYIKNLSRVPRFFASAGLEDVKMQAIGMDPGVGSTFYTSGSMFNSIPMFKKTMPWLESIVKKYLAAGPLGAGSSELNELVQAAYRSMEGQTDFKVEMEELYGDFEDFEQRIIGNTIIFGLTSITHFDRNDFKTTAQKRRVAVKLIDKRKSLLDKEIENTTWKKLEGKEPSRVQKEEMVIEQLGKIIKEGKQEELDKIKDKEKRQAQKEESKKAANKLKKIIDYGDKASLLNHRFAIESQINELNPFRWDSKLKREVENEEFEDNFMQRIAEPLFAPHRGQKGFKEPTIEFVNSKTNPDVRKRFASDKTNSQYNEKANTILIDKGRYKPGQGIHELTHWALKDFFKNSTVRKNAMESFRNVFDNEVIGKYKGKELGKLIDKVYKEYTPEEKAEEFIGNMVEILTNPTSYYDNAYTTGNVVREIFSEVRLWQKAAGIDVGGIRTTRDLVVALADMGVEITRKDGLSDYSSNLIKNMPKQAILPLIDVVGYSVRNEGAVRDLVRESRDFSKEERFEKAPSTTPKIKERNKSIYDDIVERAGDVPKSKWKEFVTDTDKANLFYNNEKLPTYVAQMWREKYNLTKEQFEDAKGGLQIKLFEYIDRWDPAKNDAAGTYLGNQLRKHWQNIGEEIGVLTKIGPNKYVFTSDLKFQGKSGEDIDFDKLPLAKQKDIFPPPFDLITEKNIQEGTEVAPPKTTLESFNRRITIEGKESKESFYTPEKVEEIVTRIKEKSSRLPVTYKESADLTTIVEDVIGAKGASKIVGEDGTFQINSTRLKPEEIGNIREFVIDNIDLIADILPEGHTGMEVSEDIKGTSTGVQKSFLTGTNIYEKNTRVQTPAGLPVYSKITDKGKVIEALTEVVEKGKDTQLKSLMYQIGKAVTNKETSKLLDKEIGNYKQIYNDLTSGGSPLRESRYLEALQTVEGYEKATEKELKKLVAEAAEDRDAFQKDHPDVLIAFDNARILEIEIKKDNEAFTGKTRTAISGIDSFEIGMEYRDDYGNIKKDPVGATMLVDSPQEATAIMELAYESGFIGDYETNPSRVVFPSSLNGFLKSDPSSYDRIKEILAIGTLTDSLPTWKVTPQGFETRLKNIIKEGKKEGKSDIEIQKEVDELQDNHYNKFVKPVLSFIPKEINQITKSTAFGNFGSVLPQFFKFGNPTRGIGNTGSVRGKKFIKDTLKSLDIKELKKQDKELGEAWEEFTKVSKHFEPANSAKIAGFNIGEIRKIGENKEGFILKDGTVVEAGKATVEQKKAKIDEIVDLNVIDALRKFDYAINLSISRHLDAVEKAEGPEARSEAVKNVWDHFQMNTNHVLSDRALAPFTYIYLKEGLQPPSDFSKGEHWKDSARKSWQTFKALAEGNYTRETALQIQKGYDQILGPKEKFNLMDHYFGRQSQEPGKLSAAVPELDIEYDIYSFEKRKTLGQLNFEQRMSQEVKRIDESIKLEEADNIVKQLNANEMNIIRDPRVPSYVKKVIIEENKLSAPELDQVLESNKKLDQKVNDEVKVKESRELNSSYEQLKYGEFLDYVTKYKNELRDEDLTLLKFEAEGTGTYFYNPTKKSIKMGDGYMLKPGEARIPEKNLPLGHYHTSIDITTNPKNVVEDVADVEKMTKNMIYQRYKIKDAGSISAAESELLSKTKTRIKLMPSSAQHLENLYLEVVPGVKQTGSKEVTQSYIDMFENRIVNTFIRGKLDYIKYKQNLLSDFKAVNKNAKMNLKDRIWTDSPFNKDHAIRMFLWDKNGYEIPGVEKEQIDTIKEYMFREENADLLGYALQLENITKFDFYKPEEGWVMRNLNQDFNRGADQKREYFLKEFIDNKNIIFSKDNIDAMAGGGAGELWKSSMIDILDRMETGRTRSSTDPIGRRLVNWFHGSTALALFGNRKSMLNQLLSTWNYAKMGDNNIFDMTKTMTTEPQQWMEAMKFIAKNGGYLKARGGDWNLSLKELTEIETKLKTYKDKGVEFSFILSKLGDRAAILMGGGTFLVNSTKKIMKAMPEMSFEEARDLAFFDFVKHTEGTQQSTWANFLSKQQTKASGKLLLNFLNTQMRYNNISLAEIKKLQKGVGGLESIGKILNYSGLQVAAFAFATEGVGFLLSDTEMDDSEKSRKLKEKEINAYLKSMNNIIEGTGIGGKAATTVIAMIKEAYPMLTGERKRAADIALASLQVSPAVQIKFKKLQAMGYEMAAGNYLRAGTKLVSATTNFGGFESIYDLVDQYNFIFNERYTTMQHAAVALGWSPYSQDKDYYKNLKEEKRKEEQFGFFSTDEIEIFEEQEEESMFGETEEKSKF